MHGNRGSRPPVRRYLCSGRRHGHGCEQPITKAGTRSTKYNYSFTLDGDGTQQTTSPPNRLPGPGVARNPTFITGYGSSGAPSVRRIRCSV